MMIMKKDVNVMWTSDMEQEFKSIKVAIANPTQLKHFDHNKPVVIETNASLKGLAVVLIQNGKPVNSSAIHSLRQNRITPT